MASWERESDNNSPRLLILLVELNAAADNLEYAARVIVA